MIGFVPDEFPEPPLDGQHHVTLRRRVGEGRQGLAGPVACVCVCVDEGHPAAESDIIELFLFLMTSECPSAVVVTSRPRAESTVGSR